MFFIMPNKFSGNYLRVSLNLIIILFINVTLIQPSQPCPCIILLRVVYRPPTSELKPWPQPGLSDSDYLGTIFRKTALKQTFLVVVTHLYF